MRFYPLVNLCWLFLFQVLHAKMACVEVVQAAKAALALAGHAKLPSDNTGAYCQARKKIPCWWLAATSRRLAIDVERKALEAWKWMGRRVYLIDATCLRTPDTAPNQKAYAYAGGVKKGCGFPQVRAVAILSLTAGTMLRFLCASYALSERALARLCLKDFRPGDVWLADRGFCGYAEFYLSSRRRVDVVARKHHTLGPGLETYIRFNKNDRVCLWNQPHKVPAGIAPKAWKKDFPETQFVREVTFEVAIPGFRTRKVTILTTLVDRNDYPAHKLAELYRMRWRVELRLRDLKGPLGLEDLRCRTPKTVQLEIDMRWLVYNLVRAAMAEAAREAGRHPDRISFTGAMGAIRQWAPRIAQASSKRERTRLFDCFLDSLAGLVIPDRPNRCEPRVIKKKPPKYPYMTKPRDAYRREALSATAQPKGDAA